MPIPPTAPLDEAARAAREDAARARLARSIRASVRQAGGPSAVAQAAAVPLKSLNNYMAGLAEPKGTVLARIAQACGVGVDALLASDADEGNAESGTVGGGASGFVAVPRRDVRASAGAGALAVPGEESEAVAFRESWLRALGIAPRNAEFITAHGDSMEPTIRDGDLLLIDRGVDRVRQNGIYAVVIGGLVRVKRLQVNYDGSVRLISDNRAYEAELVPAADVPDLRIEGRVRWHGRVLP